jgi:hypothetical protein
VKKTSTKDRRRGILQSLRHTEGAIDLASIMVGVLVIGIVGGVIAATVFAVVPWSQDKAAKQALDAVHTAESVSFVRDGAYVDGDRLVNESKLIQDTDTIAIAVGDDGKCFVAISQSATGNRFWTDDKGPDIRNYTPGTSTSDCVDIDVVAGTLPPVGGNGGPGNNPGGDGTPTPTAGLPLNEYHEDGVRFATAGMDPNAAAIKSSVPWASSAALPLESGVLTDVQIWIDGKPAKTVSDFWAFAFDDGIGLTDYNGPIRVGDGSIADRDRFFANGILRATIDGVPGNTFFFSGAVEQDEEQPGPAPLRVAQDTVQFQTWSDGGLYEGVTVKFSDCSDLTGAEYEASAATCYQLKPSTAAQYPFLSNMPIVEDRGDAVFYGLTVDATIWFDGEQQGAGKLDIGAVREAGAELTAPSMNMKAGFDWYVDDHVGSFMKNGHIDFEVDGVNYTYNVSASNARIWAGMS